MPMTWNAEADAKLFAAIMQVYDVRPAGKQLQKVAEIMGPECTAKALTHRLAKFRNMAKEGGGTPEKARPAKATPKSGGKKRKVDTSVHDEEDDDDEETSVNEQTPSRCRNKRAVVKRSYAESDDEMLPSADVKTEENTNGAAAMEISEGYNTLF